MGCYFRRCGDHFLAKRSNSMCAYLNGTFQTKTVDLLRYSGMCHIIWQISVRLTEIHFGGDPSTLTLASRNSRKTSDAVALWWIHLRPSSSALTSMFRRSSCDTAY